MNQFFTAGAALVLVLSLWGLGKRPKNLFRRVASKSVAIQSKELVLPTKDLEAKTNFFIGKHPAKWSSPKNSKERLTLKRHLFHLISLGPDERLDAVQIASKWGHPSVIPILRRGLRDSDSRVVISSAEGMNQFRTFKNPIKNQKSPRPPRNIFLMR